jgi:hypothetical protein
MTCDDARARLLVAAGEPLADADAAAVDAHAAGCPRCARRLALSRAVQAPRLPDILPGRDLWPAIRARVSAPELHAAPPRGSWVPAASLALALGVAALLATTGALRTRARLALVPEEGPSAAEMIRESFVPTRRALLKLVAERAGDLALGTGVEGLSSAIGQLHAALAADPDNPQLLRQLTRAYREELRALRRAAEGPASQPPDPDPAS